MHTGEQNGGVALTIAGFDPSSGAGVTADVLTLAAHGVFAAAAITAVTVQSTKGVFAVEPVAVPVLRETLAQLEDDMPPAGVKIGMLASAMHAEVVLEYLTMVRMRRTIEVVLDPVLRSSSGVSLLHGDDGAHALRGLLALVDAVTPNLDEAALLTGMPCQTRSEMARCAEQLRREFSQLTVVVTGGHLAECADLLCDAEGQHWMEGRRVQSRSTHGTGCAFSSALLAERLLGSTWQQAARHAKSFVLHGIERAVPHGAGRGPLALLPQLEKASADRSV